MEIEREAPAGEGLSLPKKRLIAFGLIVTEKRRVVKMTNIFGITANIQELEALLAAQEEGEEPDQKRIARLTAFLIDEERLLADKVDGYTIVYRSLEAIAQARREEAKHLTELARYAEKDMERLKEAVKFVSDSLGQPRLEGKTRTITISSGGYAIEIVNEQEIPVEFKEEVVTIKIDKNAIRDQFVKTGEIVAGTEPRPITRVLFR